jgi:hypothetical protein
VRRSAAPNLLVQFPLAELTLQLTVDHSKSRRSIPAKADGRFQQEPTVDPVNGDGHEDPVRDAENHRVGTGVHRRRHHGHGGQRLGGRAMGMASRLPAAERAHLHVDRLDVRHTAPLPCPWIEPLGWGGSSYDLFQPTAPDLSRSISSCSVIPTIQKQLGPRKKW